MNVKKVGVLAMWAVLASAFLLPDDSMGGKIGRGAFFVTVAAHFVEYLIYRPKLRRAEGTPGHHFLHVMVFGMFHYEEVEAELARKSRSALR